jgi:hypothetical protein
MLVLRCGGCVARDIECSRNLTAFGIPIPSFPAAGFHPAAKLPSQALPTFFTKLDNNRQIPEPPSASSQTAATRGKRPSSLGPLTLASALLPHYPT